MPPNVDDVDAKIGEVLNALALHAGWYGFDKASGTEGEHTSSTPEEALAQARHALQQLIAEAHVAELDYWFAEYFGNDQWLNTKPISTQRIAERRLKLRATAQGGTEGKTMSKMLQHNSLDGFFTEALMKNTNWDMETVRTAALICSNALLLNKGYPRDVPTDEWVDKFLDRLGRNVAVMGLHDYGYSVSIQKYLAEEGKKLSAYIVEKQAPPAGKEQQ
jgi:hypothetical protein